MVATLLKLRYRILANSLLRNKWQLVGAIIGGLYGIGLLTLSMVGLVFLRVAQPEIAATALILAGSLLLLGWGIVPLFAAGADRTLDPQRFAVFPIRRRTLMVAITCAGVLGIPGIVTTLVAFSTAIVWSNNAIALIAAIVMAPIIVVSCVIFTQFTVSLATRLSASRRYRELVGVLIFIPIVAAGPLFAGAANGIQSIGDILPSIASTLSWTPFGAAWAVPATLAQGQYLPALAQLAIALATVALLAWGWSLTLSASEGISQQTGGGKVRSALGAFRFFPGTPAGAIAARCFTNWFRDPRYARSLIIVPLMPIVFWFAGNTTESWGLLNASAPVVAFLLSLSSFTDLSYDSTAYSAHLAHGVRGIDDRVGRSMPVAIFTFIPSIAIAVITVAISDSWSILPGLIGLTVGIGLTGLAVSAVSSAFVLMPVPDATDSPWASKPGSGMITMLGTFGTFGALFVLILPEFVIFMIMLVGGQSYLGWVCIAVGVVLGGVLYVVGIRWGGSILDRRGPEMLARLGAHA